MNIRLYNDINKVVRIGEYEVNFDTGSTFSIISRQIAYSPDFECESVGYGHATLSDGRQVYNCALFKIATEIDATNGTKAVDDQYFVLLGNNNKVVLGDNFIRKGKLTIDHGDYSFVL